MNNSVYIYRSHIDGTFFARTTPLPKNQISYNVLDGKDIPEGIIRNKESLRKFLKEWEGIVGEDYLSAFSRHVKNLMYGEEKQTKGGKHGATICKQ